jgi:succinate dehydrogenase / fumarate reductase iron-sulfur subunit
MKRYTFTISRFNAEKDKKPYLQAYTLEVSPTTSVLDCLNLIQGHFDGTLSFRRSCRSGICGSCAMNINGKNMLACETQLSDLGKRSITINPLTAFTVLKDLIVDFDEFFQAIATVLPYIRNRFDGLETLDSGLDELDIPATDQIAGALSGEQKPPEKTAPDVKQEVGEHLPNRSGLSEQKETRQTPEERAKLDTLYECILCGACTSSCPSFKRNKRFLGPAALLKAFRYNADTRDSLTSDRLKVVDSPDGVWQCRSIFNCVEACPKNLCPPKAIQHLQKECIGENLL